MTRGSTDGAVNTQYGLRPRTVGSCVIEQGSARARAGCVSHPWTSPPFTKVRLPGVGYILSSSSAQFWRERVEAPTRVFRVLTD